MTDRAFRLVAFEFGVQGWQWGEPKPRAVTFFLDNTALVSDQYGRPIRGSVMQDAAGAPHEVYFAVRTPQQDDLPGKLVTGANGKKVMLGSHADVVAALAAEGVKWQTLDWSGWPQLPYDILKAALGTAPPTPEEELRKITDPTLRRDALRLRREVDQVKRGVASEDDE